MGPGDELRKLFADQKQALYEQKIEESHAAKMQMKLQEFLAQRDAYAKMKAVDAQRNVRWKPKILPLPPGFRAAYEVERDIIQSRRWLVGL